MGAAPLFIGVGHYYLVETMQVTAVAWFVFLMGRTRHWNGLLLASQLLLATAFAMLAKVSSPLFCFGPGLVVLYCLVRPRRHNDSSARRTEVVSLASALVLAAGTIAWYYLNIQTVTAHVSMASSGPVAELYGKSEQLLPSLNYWLRSAYTHFFSPATIVVTAGTVCAAIVTMLRARDERTTFELATGVAAIQIAVTLFVFSFSSNRDDRYMLPLLPYFGLIVCWSLARVNRQWVTIAAIVAFGFQWGHAHARALGLAQLNPKVSWLNHVMTDPREGAILDAIVRRTCADTSAGFYWNVVGVQLLWLNPPGVSYAAAKQFAPDHRLTCDYDAIAYFDTDENTAWARVMSRNILYYIGLDASAYVTPETHLDQTVNALNESILNRLERSGMFQLEASIPEHNGILILKRVDRIDHVAYGRALSDRGQHEQAVEELQKATALDPGNVEAWANLAFAYERQGNVTGAMSAGLEARRLSPNHYYVNLGLARALFQQQEWTAAVERAEDAVAQAPGPSERVAALMMAARSAFAARDATKGCTLLRTADSLQSSPEIRDDMEKQACAR